MRERTTVDRHRALALLGALAGLSVALGGCNYTSGEVVTASVPDDYRLRHPIAVEEANHSIVIFVGHARGGLSASQRADVMGLARTWVREGTGAIVADVPVDTANARAAASAFHEIQAVLAAGGVPAHGITLHHYHPDDPQTLPTIRLSYPKISAVAGPCGLWPEDIGPSVLEPRLQPEQAVLQFRLRESAQPGGDDRQSGGPRAAALRNSRLYGAAFGGVREIPQGRADHDQLSRSR